ncbi:MAG: RHS repeat domain-containing protein [Methylophilus sp.]
MYKNKTRGNFKSCFLSFPDFFASLTFSDEFHRFLRIQKTTVLIISLFSISQSVYAVDSSPLLWSSGISYNNSGGCGFSTKYENEVSAKELADKNCADIAKHNACFLAHGIPADTATPPSIHIATIAPTATNPNYQYRYTCTNTVIVGYYSFDSKTLHDIGNPECNGIRDPINLVNGNNYQSERVYAGVVGGNGLNFNITYNSIKDTEQKMLGIGWRAPYDRFVTTELFADVGLAAVRRPDGASYGFQTINGNLAASSDKTYSLDQIKDGQGVTTSWQFNNELTGETELYSTDGKLNAIANRAGQTQTITYSCNVISANCPIVTPTNIAPVAGLPVSVTDQLGRSLHFSYDASSRLSTMTNPEGAVYTYSYDVNNNLKSITYPDNKTKTYHYENSAFINALTGVTDENTNRYATWTYDTTGRAVSFTLTGEVEKSTLVYNTNGPANDPNPLSTVVTDVGTGAVRTYSLTKILGSTKSTGQSQPAGSGCAASAAALTYDANGNIATRTDFNGNKTTYDYDLTRNTETSRTEGLTTAGAATAATRTITTTWHATWRLPLTISEYAGSAATGTPLKTTTYTYDAKGNITSVSEADPINNKTRTTITTYTYSTAVPGLVLTKVVDGPRTDVSDITTYQYYPHDATCTASTAAPITDPITGIAPDNLGCRGQLMSITNALNQTTTYDRYNHHGQVEQMTDANGLVTTYSYDLRQRILSHTVGTETTSYAYDNVGQLTTLTLPDGSTLNYTYDAAHRLTDITDSLSNRIHYTLDTEGNRTQEDITDPNNVLTRTLSRSYDALNRMQQLTGIE